jgi:hypothetical protein
MQCKPATAVLKSTGSCIVKIFSFYRYYIQYLHFYFAIYSVKIYANPNLISFFQFKIPVNCLQILPGSLNPHSVV